MEYCEPGCGGSDEWQNFCLEPARSEQAPCDIPRVGFQHALVQQAAVPQQYAHTTGVDATIANQEKSPQKGALRQVLSTMTTQATQPSSNTKGDSTVAAPSTTARPTARFSAPSTSRQPSVTASNTLWSTQEQPATMPGTSSTLPTHNPRSLNSGKELWHQLKPFAMPKFDGTKREYASWKAAFQACVDNAQVTPEQKLLQLHNYLTGDALKAISGLGYSAAAYKVAIDRLERKYGGQRCQIALQLEAVEAFPTVRNGRADDLEKLADLLDVTIINLTDGGQQSELSGSILFAKLQGKLPVILLRQYHRWCYERSMPETVMSLLEWVTLEAEFATSAAELIHGVDKLPSSSQQQANGPAYRPAHHTFAGYESDNRECTICAGEHAVHQCQGFLQHDVAKRWVIAKNSRLCYRCLQPGHRGNQCASNHRCAVQGCTDTHNPLLHWNMVTKRTPASVAPRSRRAPRSPLLQNQDSPHMAHAIPAKTTGSGKSLISASKYSLGDPRPSTAMGISTSRSRSGDFVVSDSRSMSAMENTRPTSAAASSPPASAALPTDNDSGSGVSRRVEHLRTAQRKRLLQRHDDQSPELMADLEALRDDIQQKETSLSRLRDENERLRRTKASASSPSVISLAHQLSNVLSIPAAPDALTEQVTERVMEHVIRNMHEVESLRLQFSQLNGNEEAMCSKLVEEQSRSQALEMELAQANRSLADHQKAAADVMVKVAASSQEKSRNASQFELLRNQVKGLESRLVQSELAKARCDAQRAEAESELADLKSGSKDYEKMVKTLTEERDEAKELAQSSMMLHKQETKSLKGCLLLADSATHAEVLDKIVALSDGNGKLSGDSLKLS